MNTNHGSEDTTGTSRREFIGRGLQGAAGLLAADHLLPLGHAAETRPDQVAGKVASKVKAKSVIQVFLWGGMSHIDTWDPKPAAGYNFMGNLAAVIATKVPGVQLGGLFPKLAEQADKFSLVRGMTHRNNGHETAAYLMQTGHTPGERLAYPSIGAVFSWFKSPEHKGVLPPYVVLTRSQGRFSEEGFLGPKFKPFETGGDPNAARFEVEGIIARGITDDRQKARHKLLNGLNTMGRALAGRHDLADADEARRQAYELIWGRAGKCSISRKRSRGCATVMAATSSVRIA